MTEDVIEGFVRDYPRVIEALRDGTMDLDAARRSARINADLEQTLLADVTDEQESRDLGGIRSRCGRNTVRQDRTDPAGPRSSDGELRKQLRSSLSAAAPRALASSGPPPSTTAADHTPRSA